MITTVSSYSAQAPKNASQTTYCEALENAGNIAALVKARQRQQNVGHFLLYAALIVHSIGDRPFLHRRR